MEKENVDSPLTSKKGQTAQLGDPLLDENPDRFCIFPIKYDSVWEYYKKAEASFWTGIAIIETDVTSHSFCPYRSRGSRSGSGCA